MEPEEKEKDAEKSPTVSWISSLYCVHNVLQENFIKISVNHGYSKAPGTSNFDSLQTLFVISRSLNLHF